MVNVTIEDCAKIIDNRFELSVLVAHRAKIISSGGEVSIDRNGNKSTVVALREIAEGTLDIDKLRDAIVKGNQTIVALDKYGVEEINILEDSDDSTEIKEEISSFEVSKDLDSHMVNYEDDIIDE